MRFLLISMILFLFFQPVFASDNCDSCKTECRALAEKCDCLNIDTSDSAKCKAIGESCAGQCRIIFERDEYCPSANEIWDSSCGQGPIDSPCPSCVAECRSIAKSCKAGAADSDAVSECIVFGGMCEFQCKIEYNRNQANNENELCKSGAYCWPGSSSPDTSSPDLPESNLCKNVLCSDNCDGLTRYYDGECNSETGECLYASEECDYACSNGKCMMNVEAPSIIIETTPNSVVLSQKQEINIMVQVIGKDGKAVENADIYIRVKDPKQTGVLGSWGFVDVNKYTDSTGIASATLGLPSMKSIERTEYENFPLELEVEVTAAKHKSGEDWSAVETSKIKLDSPVPKITKIWIDPDPAEAYEIHNLYITVDDLDNSSLEYIVRCFGGTLGPHISEKSNSDENGRVFTSSKQNEVIQWNAPAKGVDADELVEFKEMNSNLKGLATNLGLNAVNTYSVVGGAYKAANGLNSNAQNLAQDFHGIYNSESWKEAAYRGMDMGLEGFKTFVGIYSLAFKSAPGPLGSLSSSAGDLVDAGIGTVQAKVNGWAHQARVNGAETRVTKYGCAVIVTDEEEYSDWKFYQFDLEYEGYESDKSYGKKDKISE